MSANKENDAAGNDEVRYARHIVLPEVGSAGQAQLAGATALVVGLGGLGCPAAQLLASCGVGKIWLNDFDTVDASNLPRQILYTPADVGRHKTAAAAARLLELNPSIVVEQIRDRLSVDEFCELLDGIDVVLDGTDNFSARFAVNDACVATGTPLVSGAAIRLEGQVVVFRNDGNGPCYRCIYDESDEWLGDCQGNGVLAPVTATIGAMMALETLKLLIGIDAGQATLLLWDARSGDWTPVALRRNPNCVSCAESV